jgi:MFS family permease
LLFAAISIAGFCVVGGQPAANALAASYYPTSLRATEVGWSLGIGRFGSILGPVTGGALIGLRWPNSWLFAAATVPALISGLMIVCLGLCKAAGAPATEGGVDARHRSLVVRASVQDRRDEIPAEIKNLGRTEALPDLNCEWPGAARIGFGECRASVLPARPTRF